MMAISKRLRYEVLRRDDHACRYCGATAADAKLTIDHVVPVALGGTDDATNLVAACRDCNAGKSSSNPDQPLVDRVSADALRWGSAMARAAAIQATDRERRAAYVAAFDDAWLGWGVGEGEGRRTFDRDADWRRSVARWHDLGVEVEVLVDLVDDVMPRKGVSDWNMWKYFCGAAWAVVRQRQEMAAEILGQDEGPA